MTKPLDLLRRGWLLGGALLIAVAALPLCAAAQDDEVDPAEERAQTFEAAAEGAQTENVPGGLLMVAAYGVIWVLVLGYVGSLGIRQARTAADLERLRQDLAIHHPEETEG